MGHKLEKCRQESLENLDIFAQHFFFTNIRLKENKEKHVKVIFSAVTN